MNVFKVKFSNWKLILIQIFSLITIYKITKIIMISINDFHHSNAFKYYTKKKLTLIRITWKNPDIIMRKHNFAFIKHKIEIWFQHFLLEWVSRTSSREMHFSLNLSNGKNSKGRPMKSGGTRHTSSYNRFVWFICMPNERYVFLKKKCQYLYNLPKS